MPLWKRKKKKNKCHHAQRRRRRRQRNRECKIWKMGLEREREKRRRERQGNGGAGETRPRHARFTVSQDVSLSTHVLESRRWVRHSSNACRRLRLCLHISIAMPNIVMPSHVLPTLKVAMKRNNSQSMRLPLIDGGARVPSCVVLHMKTEDPSPTHPRPPTRSLSGGQRAAARRRQPVLFLLILLVDGWHSRRGRG